MQKQVSSQIDIGFQAKAGVPSRNLTSNLEFRTLPLCALSYGDDKLKWPLGRDAKRQSGVDSQIPNGRRNELFRDVLAQRKG